MFSKFLAAAALTVVSAADVPLFSSNDDYDEINLNIRMLSNGTAPEPKNITVETTMTGDFGVNSSSELAPGGSSYSNFNTGMCNYLREVDGNATACVVTNVVDGRRRLSEAAEKRRLAAITIKVTSAMTYPSAAKALVGAATVTSGTSDASAAAAAIKTKLEAAGITVTGSITGVSTEAKAPVTPPAPAAAAPAAAAPSPSPSSNAAKVAVSTLAALSAFVASLL